MKRAPKNIIPSLPSKQERREAFLAFAATVPKEEAIAAAKLIPKVDRSEFTIIRMPG